MLCSSSGFVAKKKRQRKEICVSETYVSPQKASLGQGTTLNVTSSRQRKSSTLRQGFTLKQLGVKGTSNFTSRCCTGIRGGAAVVTAIDCVEINHR